MQLTCTVHLPITSYMHRECLSLAPSTPAQAAASLGRGLLLEARDSQTLPQSPPALLQLILHTAGEPEHPAPQCGSPAASKKSEPLV